MANMATLFRRYAKGSGLLNSEVDFNWDTISAYVNAQAALQGISLNDDGTLKRPLVERAASTNGTDAYAITVDGTYATPADYAGIIFVVHVGTANTAVAGHPTLAVNGATPIIIRKLVNVPLAVGDVRVNQEAILTYDPVTAVFILHNPATNARDNYGAASGTQNFIINIADTGLNTFEVPTDWYAGYSGSFKADSTLATVPATLNITSSSPAATLTGGAKALKKYAAGGKVALAMGDITAGNIYGWIYDGTDVVLLNPNPDPIIYRSAQVAFTAGFNKPFDAVAHGLGGTPDFAELIMVNIGDSAGGTWLLGDQVPARCLKAVTAARPSPFVLIFNRAAPGPDLGTSFTVVKTGTGTYVLINKAGSAEVVYTDAQLVADWELRVVLGRYKRPAAGTG